VNETDAIRLVEQAIWSVIVGSGPAIGAAMAVGIVIALLQALTQVQEATLTFVPKILVVFAMLILVAPLAASQLMSFTEEVYMRIATGF
jgi:flagellar biosynthetic protein FliQ